MTSADQREGDLFVATSVKSAGEHHPHQFHRFGETSTNKVPMKSFMNRGLFLLFSLSTTLVICSHVSKEILPIRRGGHMEVTLETLTRDIEKATSAQLSAVTDGNSCGASVELVSRLTSICPLVLNETVNASASHVLGAEDVINLLRGVTTNIRGFDPFASDEKPERFIPVLEARGTHDNDKDEYGHRRDTVPIADAVADSGMKTVSAVFQFVEEVDEHAKMINLALKLFLASNAHGIIGRNNPGTLSAHSQKKFDDMLRELSDAGVKIMTHPDVMSTLGAKDSLVKIKDLHCGLEDTEVYYTPEALIEGFRKSIAFQPRVIKQNRGSQGEGIWIVKLKDGNYCDTYGDCVVDLDAEIVLMEAWDNHVEYHTVGEFLEFCIHGRSEYSGVWTSTGQGRYFEGGLEAGSMMVDQRFLPRIVEGEVRCLFVGSELVEILHKKPAEGGLSATLASGAIYTKYAPDDKKFARLVQHLNKDVPRIMASFGMSDRPLPLLWTADYIYGETDDDLYVGEINCSCPGITQQLEIVPIIARVAIETVFPETAAKGLMGQRWLSFIRQKLAK